MAPSIAGSLLPSQPVEITNHSTCKYTTQTSSNRPLEWETVAIIAPQLRALAVQQLVHNWNRYKDADNYEALWGDEIEYFLANFELDRAKPLFEQARVLKKLQSSSAALCFQPEYAKCCIESNPLGPYGALLEDLLDVEPSMRERRSLIKDALRGGEAVLTLTSFPNFALQSGPAEQFISEAAPAYALSRRNLLARRQRNWKVNLPVFPDVACARFSLLRGRSDSSQDHVVLDDFNFGATQCCMQITTQARNIREARYLYDQLIPLSPIMLALTAATPIYKQRLVNTDVRWNVMKHVFDDRNQDEVAKDLLPHSRCSSNSTYISLDSDNSWISTPKNLPVDNSVLDTLIDSGMDLALARHFAHILRWEPVKLMTSDIDASDPNDTNMFELFNSSCYQGVRFKPPPGGSNPKEIGWRVEFRSMEVQPTDFENAAFSIFIYLVSRVIIEFDLKLHIPLEFIEDNYDTAHKVNAATKEEFWFRTSEWCSSGIDNDSMLAEECAADAVYGMLSIDEIINGTSPPSARSSTRGSLHFPGFIPLIKLYLARHNPSAYTESQILRYLDLVSARASGASPTPATWIRAFVRSHPDYKCDSVVSERTVFDLLSEIDRMAL